MEILFHAHHAVISSSLQTRTERALRKLEKRFGENVGATVRFEEDGPMRRVEIVLMVPRGRRYVAAAEARFFGPALNAAIAKLGARLEPLKRSRKAVARRMARA